MFNSTIIDVVIGMVFVYLLLSLMCSAANELIELWLKNRATDLERGLRELLKDPDGKGLVQQVYDHPLINGLFEGGYDPQKLGMLDRVLGRVNLPSYIPAQNFALAIFDTVFPAGRGLSSPPTSPPASPPASANVLEELRSNLHLLGNAEVERALNSLINVSENNLATFRANVEKWFDSSMDRVSGWYKRRAHIVILIIGSFVTIGLNADSVLIAKKLSADRSLRESLVSAAENYVRKDAEESRNAGAPGATESDEQAAEGTTGGAASTETPTSPTSDRSPNPEASPSPAVSPSPSPSPSESPAGGSTTSTSGCTTPQCKFQQSLTDIKALSLPIGWDSSVEGRQWPGLNLFRGEFWTGWAIQFRIHFLGWLLTALAISLGAPFWFDLLNKFIVVRSTVKPKEKSPEEESKD